MSLWDAPEAAAIAEIKRLHVFFETWFAGRVPQARLETDLAQVLHPQFAYVMPSGAVVDRADVLEMIRPAYGSNPAFRIEIRAPKLLGAFAEARLLHATYVEHQFGAINTTPPENARRATVLFEVAGGKLTWRHIQETGLPAGDTAAP